MVYVGKIKINSTKGYLQWGLSLELGPGIYSHAFLIATGKKSVKMSELQVRDRVQIGKKSVKMSELQIGDRVQTGKKSVKMSELQIGD